METSDPLITAPQHLRLERQHDILIRALLARDDVGRPPHVEIIHAGEQLRRDRQLFSEVRVPS